MSDDLIVEAGSCGTDVAVRAPADRNRHHADPFDGTPYACEGDRQCMSCANHFAQETGTLAFKHKVGAKAHFIGGLVDLCALFVPAREQRQRVAQNISPGDLGLSGEGSYPSLCETRPRADRLAVGWNLAHGRRTADLS